MRRSGIFRVALVLCLVIAARFENVFDGTEKSFSAPSVPNPVIRCPARLQRRTHDSLALNRENTLSDPS